MTPDLPDDLASVLLHTLGLDADHREPWRNHYVVGADHDAAIAQLVERGLMAQTRTPGFLAEGDRNFCATEQGKRVAVKANYRLNPPPKLTRSARRYRLWMDSGADDCGISFGEFIKGKLYQRIQSC